MSWIYFVILATFLWSITNVMDKYLVDKRVKSPLILLIFFRIASLIPIIILIPILNIGVPSLDLFFLIFVSAILMILAIITYYKAVEVEEISVSIPLFQFIPIFTLFIAFFTLGERLTGMDYLGFLILILGGFVISIRRTSGLFRIGRVFWFVMIASLLFSASYVITKFVLGYVNYWDTFMWIWIFGIFATLSMLFSGKIRSRFRHYYGKINKRDWTIISTNIIISIIASASYYFAVKLGPISLVQASENVQMIFVFFLALLFTRFYPHIMKERFDTSSLIQKILGMILIIIGVLLTQFF
ncbi:MAG: EamA family transporter [Candidatus Aenigmarchaeota archaeon]|nr:EamA family transporter [Candidatus Aenigmarchaeota archaeon]